MRHCIGRATPCGMRSDPARPACEPCSIVDVCYKKCIKPQFHDAAMNVGEKSCTERCVAKYIAVSICGANQCFNCGVLRLFTRHAGTRQSWRDDGRTAGGSWWDVNCRKNARPVCTLVAFIPRAMCPLHTLREYFLWDTPMDCLLNTIWTPSFWIK